MNSPRVQFELVPVYVAKQIAEKEVDSSLSRATRCVICGKPVEIERCKTDEDGDAVHEKCYVGKVTLTLCKSARRAPRR
jgi:hypothetical protein